MNHIDKIIGLPARYEFARETWPACPEQLLAIHEKIIAWSATSGLSPLQRKGLATAATEAVAHAISYAYPRGQRGVVQLTYWTERDAVYLEITDHGRRHRFGPTGGDGTGHEIDRMQGCVDAVLIRHDPQGTTVTLRQQLPVPRHRAGSHHHGQENRVPAPRGPLPAETRTADDRTPPARIPAFAAPRDPS